MGFDAAPVSTMSDARAQKSTRDALKLAADLLRQGGNFEFLIFVSGDLDGMGQREDVHPPNPCHRQGPSTFIGRSAGRIDIVHEED